MERLEKIFTVALVIAMAGVFLFWTAGFKGNMIISKWSLITAGISCWVALFCIGLQKLRRYHRGY